MVFYTDNQNNGIKVKGLCMSTDGIGNNKQTTFKIGKTKYDFSKMQSGVNIEGLSERSQSIFKALDGNKKIAENGAADNVLDKEELQGLLNYITQEAGGNRRLGKKEFQKLLKDYGLENSGFTREELSDFIGEVFREGAVIESSDIKTDESGNRVVVTTNKNGDVQTRNADGSYSVALKEKSKDGGTVTQYYGRDNARQKDVEVNGDTTITSTYKQPNDGSNDLLYETIVIDDNATDEHTTMTFKERTSPETGKLESVPDKAVTVSHGGDVQEEFQYVIVKNNQGVEVSQPIQTKKRENINQGNPDMETVTEFAYGQNGARQEVRTEPTQTNRGGKKVTTSTFIGDNCIEIITLDGREGEQLQTITRNTEDGGSREDVIDQRDGSTVITLNDGPIGGNGNRTLQQYIVDGKVVKQARYQDGCTLITRGFVKGRNETDAEICKRFGITMDQLKRANGGDLTHQLAQQLFIPGEVDVKEPKLLNRDEPETVIKKYNQHQQWLALDRQYRAAGLVNYKHSGERYQCDDGAGGKINVTVVGSKGNRDRLLGKVKINGQDQLVTMQKDAEGKYQILSYAYVEKTDYYDASVGDPSKVIDGVTGANGKPLVKIDDEHKHFYEDPEYTEDPLLFRHATKGGREVALDYEGDVSVVSGSLDLKRADNKRYVLDKTYLRASNQALDFAEAKRNSAIVQLEDFGLESVYKQNGMQINVDGQTFYFRQDGTQQDPEVIENMLADDIAKDMHRAADGAGTDEDLLKEAVYGINNTRVYNMVNSKLPTKWHDSKNGQQMTAVEYLLYDEETQSTVKTEYMPHLINALASDGTKDAHGNKVGVQAAGHLISGLFAYDYHGGLGGTTQSMLSETAALIPASENDEVFAAVNADFAQWAGANGYQIDASKPAVYAGAAEDGWTNVEQHRNLTATMAANGALNPEVESSHAILTDGMRTLAFDKTNRSDAENVVAGMHIAGSSAIMFNEFMNDAAAANQAEGFNAYVSTQDAAQVYLSNISADNPGGEIDMDKLTLYNEVFCNPNLLSNGVSITDNNGQPVYLKDDNGNVITDENGEPIPMVYDLSYRAEVKAQEAIITYKQDSDEIGTIFETSDPEVYAQIGYILERGDIPGCTSLEQFYQKAKAEVKDADDRAIMDANMILSGQLTFTDDQIVATCIEMMHRLDKNPSENTRDKLDFTLKALIQEHPELKDKLLQAINSGTFGYTYTTPGVNGMPGNSYSVDTKNNYLNMVKDASQITKENVFFDDDGNQVTDPEIIEYLIDVNSEVVDGYKAYMTEIERQFEITKGDEGWADKAANGFSRGTSIGTDRGDVENEFLNVRAAFNRLQAAAEGRLKDKDGNIVSPAQAQDDMNKAIEAFQTKVGKYETTKGLVKMGIVMLPVVVAAGAADVLSCGTLTPILVAGVAAGTAELAVTMSNDASSTIGLSAQKAERNLKSAANTTAITIATAGLLKGAGGEVAVLSGTTGKALSVTGRQLKRLRAGKEILVDGERVSLKAGARIVPGAREQAMLSRVNEWTAGTPRWVQNSATNLTKAVSRGLPQAERGFLGKVEQLTAGQSTVIQKGAKGAAMATNLVADVVIEGGIADLSSQAFLGQEAGIENYLMIAALHGVVMPKAAKPKNVKPQYKPEVPIEMNARGAYEVSIPGKGKRSFSDPIEAEKWVLENGGVKKPVPDPTPEGVLPGRGETYNNSHEIVLNETHPAVTEPRPTVTPKDITLEQAVRPQQKLFNSTNNGAHTGGPLSPENFEIARRDLIHELESGAVTPARYEELLNQIESLGARSREQGHQLRAILEDKTGIYLRKNGTRLDIHNSTNLDELRTFRQEVNGWSAQGRPVQFILDDIDARINLIEGTSAATHNVKPPTMSISDFETKFGSGLTKADGTPRGFNDAELADVRAMIDNASAEELTQIKKIINSNSKYKTNAIRTSIESRETALFGKFGTAENPNINAMSKARTAEDIQEALAVLERIPNPNPAIKGLQESLQTRLRHATGTPRV